MRPRPWRCLEVDQSGHRVWSLSSTRFLRKSGKYLIIRLYGSATARLVRPGPPRAQKREGIGLRSLLPASRPSSQIDKVGWGEHRSSRTAVHAGSMTASGHDLPPYLRLGGSAMAR